MNKITNKTLENGLNKLIDIISLNYLGNQESNKEFL